MRKTVKRFDDRVVWITGGGSGLGRGLALELAKRGAQIAVSGRRLDRLEEVVEAVRSAGGTAEAFVADVTDDGSIAEAVQAVVERFGGMDVAIANAGVSVSGAVERVSTEQWKRQFDINVVGLAATVRAALPHVKARKGQVVLIGSVAGMIAAPGFAPYHASKYAVRAIGQCLSMELHGTGVNCTTIHPGFVESEIAKVDNSGTYHEDRADTRPRKLMWSTERACRVMANAIGNRKREFTFTGHGVLGGWIGRHAPGLAHLVMSRAARKLRPPRGQ